MDRGKGRTEFKVGSEIPEVLYWGNKLDEGKVFKEVAGGIDLFTTFTLTTGTKFVV
ncbi:MAG: hypothetical protein ABJZ92_15080 [Cyclobacteriaceae bacterium]